MNCLKCSNTITCPQHFAEIDGRLQEIYLLSVPGPALAALTAEFGTERITKIQKILEMRSRKWKVDKRFTR